MKTKICETCGKEFPVYAHNARFCSDWCRNHVPTVRVCKTCGKVFTADGRKIQYCSDECRMAAGGFVPALKSLHELIPHPVRYASATMQPCRIRITADLLDIFPENQPERGQIYDAERWTSILTANGTVVNTHDGYIIVCGGKRIPIRTTECEEVGS